MVDHNELEERPWPIKVLSFLVTLIMIPLIFVATCVPVGILGIPLSGLFIPYQGFLLTIWFLVFILVFIVFALRKAIRATDSGQKAGIIVWIIILAVGTLFFLMSAK